MALSGKQFRIAAGRHEATIVEVGAALRRYTAGGVDVTVPYAEDVLPPRGCGNVLVPWPNRLRGGRYTFEGTPQQLALSEPDRGNAIHGLGRWARWTPALHEPSRVTLTLDIPPQKGYPFEVLVSITYALHEELGLSVSFSASNHGRGRAPFGAGLHPYLSTHGNPLDAVTLQLPARQRLLVDDAGVPIGEQSVAGTGHDLRRGHKLKGTRLDDGFTAMHTDAGRWHAEVRVKQVGAQVWADETFRYAQVFTVDDVAGGVPGIAVEPMTCAPDAFNSGDGLIVLEPGGSWSGSCGITPL